MYTQAGSTIITLASAKVRTQALSNVVRQGGKRDIAKSNTYIHTHTHVYTQVSLVTASLVPRWQNVAGNRRSGGDRCDRASPALTERSSSCARPFTRPLLAPFVVRSLRGPLFVSLRLCREYLWKLEVREKERERERVSE